MRDKFALGVMSYQNLAQEIHDFLNVHLMNAIILRMLEQGDMIHFLLKDVLAAKEIPGRDSRGGANTSPMKLGPAGHVKSMFTLFWLTSWSWICTRRDESWHRLCEDLTGRREINMRILQGSSSSGDLPGIAWQLAAGPSNSVDLQYDNAPTHNARRVSERLRGNGFIRLVHPAYSPDRGPCAFFLFGSLRKRLKQSAYNTFDELEDAIVQMIEYIPRETLLDVFVSCQRRLEKCIERD
jgi:hypothetical protein